MIMVPRRFRGLKIALLAVGAVASCGPLPSSQQPVQSSNPSVTYKYRTDQEQSSEPERDGVLQSYQLLRELRPSQIMRTAAKPRSSNVCGPAFPRRCRSIPT
jgi:hypothetical protein